MRIVVPGRRIFRCVVEQIEQHLFEQHRVQFEHRHIGRKLDIDSVVRQDLGGAGERAANEFAQILQRCLRDDRAGFEPRYVEQVGDEPVEPLRFIDDGRQKIGLGGVVERARKLRAGFRPRRGWRPAAS